MPTDNDIPIDHMIPLAATEPVTINIKYRHLGDIITASVALLQGFDVDNEQGGGLISRGTTTLADKLRIALIAGGVMAE